MVKTQIKNIYELLIILRPTLSEGDLEKNIQQIETAIKNHGGTVVKTDKPYRSKLAHKIKEFKDGFYVDLIFNAPPELPNILKRTLSITDDVLRYMIVKKDN